MTDRYKKIRDALAMGPTPGPWCILDADSEPYITARLPENEGHRWDDPTICRLYDDVTPFDSVTFGPWLEALPNAKANGSFITACDPDTAQALLEERDTLRKALEDIRSLSFINPAMQPNPLTLTALLGDIHQIADDALAQEGRNG